MLDREVGLLHRRFARREEIEHRVRVRRGRRAAVGRRLERDPADQDRHERLGLHPHPGRVERHVDAARVPEARVGGDVLVEGRAHEDLDRHALPVLVELVADDLADRQPPEVHRHPDVVRPEVVGAQDELPPGLLAGDDRRHVEGDEVAPRLLAMARIHCDVGAREQGPEPGHPARGDPRPHRPEPRVLHEEVRGVLVELGGRRRPACGPSASAIALTRPMFDVLVLDLRLARLEALRRLEADRDRRAALEDRFHGEPAAGQHRDDGDDPDELRRPAPPGRGDRLGQIRKLGRARRVSHAFSPPGPRSGADRSSRPRTSSARRPPRRRSPPARPGCSSARRTGRAR